MAVVTIDAKGELAEYVAQQRDIPGVPTPAEPPAGAPAKPNGAPAPAKEAPTATPAKEAPGKTPAPKSAAEDESTDPDDVEGEDGLTARQKREFSGAMLKAIGKKHRHMKEAEEFAAAQYSEKKLAEARAAAAEAEVQRLKGVQPATETKIDPEAGKPKRDDFPTDQAYWDAYVDWRAERKAEAKIKEQKAEEAKERERQRLADIETSARAAIVKAAEIVPDFKAVVGAIDVEVPPTVADYMQESPLFAELGYHLAQHPEVLTSLAKMTPKWQLVTIGKIEGTLKPFEPQGSKTIDGAKPSKAASNGNASHEAEPSETGSIPSKARGSAPVITPLNSASGVQVEKDIADMTTREQIQAWQKTHKANLGLRKRH